jgi:hypothetical protein
MYVLYLPHTIATGWDWVWVACPVFSPAGTERDIERELAEFSDLFIFGLYIPLGGKGVLQGRTDRGTVFDYA